MNSPCAMSGGKDAVLPIPSPKSSDPITRKGTFCPAASSSASDPPICTPAFTIPIRRRLIPGRITMVGIERPANADTVISPMTAVPRAGTSRENNCIISPIWANRPNAAALAWVITRRSRHRLLVPIGVIAIGTCTGVRLPGWPPSTCKPRSDGDGLK